MWDANLLMSDDQVIAADGYSSSAIAVGGHADQGLPLELTADKTAGSSSDTLLVFIMAKDTDAGWSTTPSATIDRVCTFELIGALDARQFQRVFTSRKYIKGYYDITNASGSASYICNLGVVSGFQRDAGI